MSQFKDKVIQAVRHIPFGRVVSYGQVALIVGFPRGARQVGWILNGTERDGKNSVPWWRVINNAGRISIKGAMVSADLQRKLLESEGIEVVDLRLDIEKHRWRPTKEELRELALPDEYIQMIIEKYGI